MINSSTFNDSSSESLSVKWEISLLNPTAHSCSGRLRLALDGSNNSQLFRQTGSQLRLALDGSNSSQLFRQTGSQLRLALDGSNSSQLFRQTGSQLRLALDGSNSSQLFRQMGSQLCLMLLFFFIFYRQWSVVEIKLLFYMQYVLLYRLYAIITLK